jgi:hypothetical protein
MKKIRGAKPIGVMIHTYKEISQGNSLFSYLYHKPKCHVFCFICSLFSPTKSENRREEQVLPRGKGWHQWERGHFGKRGLEGEHSAIKCLHM